MHLGLLPGAGGTQRLPRIVGPEQAAPDMVTSGKHVDAKTSLAAGLFDEVVPEGQLRSGAVALAQRVMAEKRPLRKVRDQNDKVWRRAASGNCSQSFARRMPRKFRGFLAPSTTFAASKLP